MGAVVLADPGFEARGGTKRRYAVPLVLVAGWVVLFGYSAAYLTEDMPFRSQRAEEQTAPALREALPPRVIVVPAPEAETRPVVSAPVSPDPARAATPPAVVAPPRPAPAQPGAGQSSAGADYVGVWGPTAEACGTRSHRRGYLPATITPERAKAGRTVCDFHDGHRVGNAWVMAAECRDRGRRWSSQVRLTVDGDHLTWSSSRGTAAYIRCGRRGG